ncbi:unnamed protein product [Bursaphelenchus okinawaensis]|uniref:Soluble calcium-activated nucleotidase 1 n=1 Tax=Bursaphelenchus okinawaensis TaxID=465554 RepID=A0A811LPR5_9BILA|nr:unnamed protein product [Bursaphelenchus okinawaensis]CAG9125902.1 unnamed protein product [Bursaphelenchus okinawaensis]
MVSQTCSPCLRDGILSKAWFIYLNLGMVFLSFTLLVYNLPSKDIHHRYVYNESLLVRPQRLPSGDIKYNIVVVTDLDHLSKNGNHWHSYLKRGFLVMDETATKASVHWSRPDVVLKSDMAAKGRAMELSDLVVFDGQLLSVDDRTGLIYKIMGDQIVPWVFLNDGPGNTTKAFKAEWMTVKDDYLYIGGLGKEWTTASGEYVNDYPMWVKRVSFNGEVVHLNWTHNYKMIRKSLGIGFPAYLIHESCQWSKVHQKWFFLPRRVSEEPYDENKDEFKGSNIVLMASENFANVKKLEIGDRGDGTRGFSAFQFVPNTNDDVIVALKSEEREGRSVASYISVFRISDRTLLMTESRLEGAYKFEGLEFA